jgi:HEAT repeat protein
VAVGYAQSFVPSSKDEEEIKTLIRNLSHSDYATRKAAGDTLIARGSVAVPALIEACYSSDGNLRWEAVNVLGYIGDERSLDALAKCVLEDDDVHARWRSIWAISSLDQNKVAKKLLEGLHHSDHRIVWNAAVALATMGRKEAIPILYTGLQSKEEWIQWEAVNAFSNVYDENTVPTLVNFLKTASDDVAQETILSLGKIRDKSALPAIIKALEHPNPEVRWRAAMALGMMRDKTAVSALKKRLRSEKNAEVRESISTTLKELQ